jgi:hypothetical protein
VNHEPVFFTADASRVMLTRDQLRKLLADPPSWYPDVVVDVVFRDAPRQRDRL